MDNIAPLRQEYNPRSADLSGRRKRVAKVAAPLRLYCPEGFDPETVLPPHLRKFKKYALWFVHVLYIRRVLDCRKPDAFVELKADYLRRVLPWRNYKEILSCLESAGVIVIDPHYIQDEKCRGYRLVPELLARPHRLVTVADRMLSKKIATMKRTVGFRPELDIHKHLVGQLDRVSIDFVSDLESTKFMAADMIRNKDWHFSVCRQGRVHTNLSSLHRDLRPKLSVSGSRLVNLDIKNSQPLFLGFLLKNYFENGFSLESIQGFCHGDSGNKTFNSVKSDTKQDSEKKNEKKKTLKDIELNRNKEEPHTHPTHTHTLRCDNCTLPDDVKRYLALAESGTLYEELMAEWGIDDRDTFKGRFFQEVLFCRNPNHYDIGRRFAASFPSIARAIATLKERDHAQAAILLQRHESAFIIHRVCRRIMRDCPTAFLSTIHDSILCLPENADQFLSVLREEFAQIGLKPTIRVESYADQGGPVPPANAA